MPCRGVLNRRCYTCGTQTSHTHGIHFVAESGSFFFCRAKCRSKFDRGCKLKRPRHIQRALTQVPPVAACCPQSCMDVADIAPTVAECTTITPWAYLPANVLMAVLQLLEIRDMLSMGCVCQHWKGFIGSGAKSLQLSLEDDDDAKSFSHMVHLLPYMMPEVDTLRVTLSPLTSFQTQQFQVLAHYTNLKQLSVDVPNGLDDSAWYEQRCWLPALTRLTHLQSLSLKVTTASLHLAPLSSLRHLTRLHITNHEDDFNTGMITLVEPVEEELAALGCLPSLQDLDLQNTMLSLSSQVSQIATLTSLRIRGIRGDMYRKHMEDEQAVVVATFIVGLTGLPCLEQLRLDFTDIVDVNDWNSPAMPEHDVRTTWVPLLCQNLDKVPDLQLNLGSSIGLVASANLFTQLATLTNLTLLHMVLLSTEHPAIVNIAKLSSLTRLSSLSLSLWCTDEGLEVTGRQMETLCSSLGGLTRLELRLRPESFISPWSLMHLSLLTNLRDLVLTGPRNEKGYPLEENALKDVQLPSGCIPPSVQHLVLEKFELP